jgi:hypothetical protein
LGLVLLYVQISLRFALGQSHGTFLQRSWITGRKYFLMFNHWDKNLQRSFYSHWLCLFLDKTSRKATKTKSIIVSFFDIRSERKSGKIIFGPSFFLCDIKRVIYINFFFGVI